MTERSLPTAPYGAWPSPISAQAASAGSVALSDVTIADGTIYWTEGRPTERGRRAVVAQRPDGTVGDASPVELNARTRVHEYGGLSYLVLDDVLFVQNDADQRLYRVMDGAAPITPAGVRFADFAADRQRGRILAVREDHCTPDAEPINTIVALDPSGPNEQGGTILAEGADFYAYPRLSPDGAHLAYLCWSHPDMPWDAAELWVARVGEDGSLSDARQIAGGPEDAAFQPTWAPDGALIYVAERTGWWNLYRWEDGEDQPLCPMDAEFGAPLWTLGRTTFAVVSANRVICTFMEDGVCLIGDLNLTTKELTRVPTPFSDVASIAAEGSTVVFIAGTPTLPMGVYRHDLRTGDTDLVRSSSSVAIDPRYISVPEGVTFPTSDNQVAHAFLYRPVNADVTAPADERPPLIVMSHGGPTGGTSTVLSLRTQFWTSRGFTVLDVDYRGSTGYGREYREALRDTWGIYDVDDCIAGASYVVEQGLADPRRLAIRGGSASGYTTLAALTFHDVFGAGCSLYGISDLEAMAKETHKFESRYLDRLIGPYPEAKEVYVARSPIHHIDRLATPIILFQGLEDKVVPPNQAQMMYDAVAAKGIPVALVMYEGEQHGFRQAANIRRTLEGELYFYGRVFGFTPADAIEPVPITNLD
jgi:dipeptidyl aminopeptidase/acylaminoacyl peptidase